MQNDDVPDCDRLEMAKKEWEDDRGEGRNTASLCTIEEQRA